MNVSSKTLAIVSFGLFILIGTYNAVVINSASEISGTEVSFVKRLDEVYGVNVPGRGVAASMNWEKLESKPVSRVPIISQPVTITSSAPTNLESSTPDTSAAVQEELNLSLVEVINPKKWQNGLTTANFNGSLSTNNGVIEALSVSLPNGEGLSVSFSEMTGNVFEYDINGELYSGMMYQVDQSAYMVTLTNGPLEGTRLRFTTQSNSEEQSVREETLANNNFELGSSLEDQQNPLPDQPYTEALLQQDEQLQQEAIQAQSLNSNAEAAM